MTERAAPRWKTSDWRGHANYVCAVPGCLYATLDRGAMVLHARGQHPLPSEGAQPQDLSPLRGVNFQTDRAAEHAIAAGLSAKSFDGITPTGATGGFTVADVKAAARSTS